MKTWIFHAAFAAAVFLAAVFTYGNTLQFNFTWDDPMILSAAVPPTSVEDAGRAFTIQMDRLYRPVRTLVYMFENYVFKFKPAGYHCVNILLYGVACVAFYAMAAVILRGSPVAAACAAAFFVTLPSHAEVASSVGNGCADLLCAIFSFATISILASARKRPVAHAWGLPLFALALLSKESAVTLPAAIFALAASRELVENKEKYGRALCKALSFASPYLLLAVVYFFIRGMVVRGVSQTSSFHGGNFEGTIIASLSVVPDYAAMLFVPVKQCALYVISATGGLTLKSVAGIAILVSSSAGGLYFLRKSISISFAILFILFAWLPSSNIIPIAYIKAARFMFLPSAGACMISGIIVSGIFSRLTASEHTGRNAAITVSIASGLVFAVFAREASAAWRDARTLWSDTVQCAPQSTTAWNNLGKVCFQQGSMADAISAFNKAIEVNPAFPQPYDNLAAVYGSAARYGDALNALLKSKSVAPGNPATDCKLWFCYEKLGRSAEAEKWRALCVKSQGPGDPNVYIGD